MVNWSIVEHGLEVTKHMRHPQLGTKGGMGWGCPLLGFCSRVRSRSYKGQVKVKSAKILNNNIFYSVHMFLLQGGVPLDYSLHNVAGSLISPPVLALTSGQNEVNRSLEEHGLHVTEDLRHPHLDIKGDMGWGCPLLGLYSRIRIRSY